MAHPECVTPRTGSGTDLIDGEGPCGGPIFESVGELFELVGIRAVTLSDRRTEEADARLVVPACPG